ncbi:MAG: beta-propeller fold lactonase family protein [Candidatus Binatia bacterium]
MTHATEMGRGRMLGMAVVVATALGACSGAPGPRATAASRAGAAAAVGGAVVATVRLPQYGNDVATAADGRAYVSVSSNEIVIVDTAQAAVAATVGVDGEPFAIAVTPDGRRAYSIDLRGEEIAVVDTAQAKQTNRISLGSVRRPGRRPSAVASADGQRIFVGEATQDHLVVIRTDSDRVEKEIFLDFHPNDVAVTGDNRFVYVVGCRLACTDGTLLIIETAGFTTVSKIALASVPTALAITPNGRRAYVANGLDATVSAVDLVTQNTIDTIPVGPQPVGIAVSADGRAIYVTSFANDQLSAISTVSNTVVATAPIGDSPRAIVVSRDGRRAFVTHSSNTLSIVDLAGLGLGR